MKGFLIEEIMATSLVLQKEEKEHIQYSVGRKLGAKGITGKPPQMINGSGNYNPKFARSNLQELRGVDGQL